jgi:hypothetical protein
VALLCRAVPFGLGGGALRQDRGGMMVRVTQAGAVSALAALADWFVLAFADRSCGPTSDGYCGQALIFFALVYVGAAFLILFAAMLLARLVPLVSRHGVLWIVAGAALGALADWGGLLDRWWTPQSWQTGGDLYGPWFGAALAAPAFALAALLGRGSGRAPASTSSQKGPADG